MIRVPHLQFLGIWPNALLRGGVILSVALLHPTKPLPVTDCHRWLYLREMMQLSLVAISLLTGPQVVRDDNHFDYLAVVEVGALFIGIFIAMQPALEIRNAQGGSLGIDTPRAF